MVLEKTLESPLDSKEINQSTLKEINPESSLEGLMLKLKLQYFGHLIRRADSLEKTLMLGKVEGRRRRGTTEDEMVGMHHQLNGHAASAKLLQLCPTLCDPMKHVRPPCPLLTPGVYPNLCPLSQ